jgi:hypothetical protein
VQAQSSATSEIPQRCHNVAWDAAWYEEEHCALGIPFPPLAERLARLEETLQIARKLPGKCGRGINGADRKEYPGGRHVALGSGTLTPAVTGLTRTVWSSDDTVWHQRECCDSAWRTRGLIGAVARNRSTSRL